MSLYFIEVCEALGAIWRAVVVIAYFDIKFAEIRFALTACDGAIDDISLPHVQVLFHIEHSLLPMRILLVW